MDELGVAIAGLRVAVVAPDAEVSDVMRDRYKGFVSSGPFDWRIDLDVRPAPRRLGNEVTVTCTRGSGELVIERGDFAGTMNLVERRARVVFPDINEYSIDSFLRIFYSLALVESHGLIVHAASLVRGGRAYLFCGPSGSGKTTLARLSTDATLLSDELSIVRMSQTGPHCYGTPFWGELARAGEDCVAPLAGIYFLRHGPRHVINRVTPRQALERLFPNVMFFAKEAEWMPRLLAIAAGLVDAAPCFDLAFRLDPGFWEVIDGG